MKKTLYLLDAYALIYRAHFAFISHPLINSKGENVSAISGFVRTLWDILRHKNPDYIAVAFDVSEPTFRHEMFPEYKATREAMPEDIQFAVPYIKKILHAFHIPILEKPGFEADDIIGTMAKQAEQQGFDVYMVTPDKDFGQLVDNHILMYRPGRRGNGVEILGPEEIREIWHVKRPQQVTDMLGLVGDTSDNIPGVKGIGPKTAATLIQQYDSLENLLAHTDELKGSVKTKLESQKEQALLSKKLATIITDVPLEYSPDQLKRNGINRAELDAIFRRLEFNRLRQDILGTAQPVQGTLFANEKQAGAPADEDTDDIKNISSVPHEYTLVEAAGLPQLIRELSRHDKICLDTETTDLDPNRAELVGISLAVKPHQAWYIPVPPGDRHIVQSLKPVFENERIQKIGQNLKYDAIVLRWAGAELEGPWFDTMLAHYLLEPGLRHNLDYLARTYLNYQNISIQSLIGKKGKKQASMRDVPAGQVKEYAAEDADITLQLYQEFEPKLKKEGLEKLFLEIESPLSKVLRDMEYEGVRIDAPFLQRYSKVLAEKIHASEQKIFAKNDGRAFNLNAPRQIGTFLFEHLKIPYKWPKTKTGQYRTGEEILSELAREHEIVHEILNVRRLNKLKSTYVDALPKLINPRTGRVHSSFNQTVAATGRLSSNNPNLQNIPIRTPEGREIRKAFIPRNDDYILLSADYSQIELRIIAAISGEKAMLEAFANDLDIHRATAAKVFNVPYDQVTDDQRRQAKTVNFSIIYGAGAVNLSRQLNITRSEAKKLIDAYFKEYPSLKKYMSETVDFARKHGYVRTLSGRKRLIRDINSRNGMMRSNAERIAINTPIQGTAADMIKIAMNRIAKALADQQLQSKMILQVHDELVFDVLKTELDTVRPLVEEHMKNAMPNLNVPIRVSIGTGHNWLEAH